MARIAYTDLILKWTPTATEQTALLKIIQTTYRGVYTIMYPNEDYYTDADTNDPGGLVVNNHVFGKLLYFLSDVANDWHYSGQNGRGGEYRFAKFELPKNIKIELISWRKKQTGYCPLQNVRTMGNDYSDNNPGGYHAR